MQTVVLIGDSIRIGYQETVRAELAEMAKVRWPDANCRDTRCVLEHLAEWALETKPDVVHINTGLHDLRRAAPEADCAVPLDEYRVNVARIIRRVREQSSAQIVWATTTPINERRHRQSKDFVRLEDDVLRYNRAAMEICQQAEVPVDNLFEMVMDAGRDGLLDEDGVHFTNQGYELLGRGVANALRKCCLMHKGGSQ